ncbi:MAG: DUF368 domain-containing protein [Clostridia bacterium]|nr:DUF368 domain-containing protein [Clostridia bacterium]
MKTLLDILRGMVIGLANVIPGVSGGTMMVSMGIFDKLIHAINHLFDEFKQSLRTLWPYLAGMVLAIILSSVALSIAFERFPLPTNTLFIGLILGSVPMILAQIKGAKINALHVVLFLIFAAIVIVPKAIANATLTEGNENGAQAVLSLDLWGIIKLFLLGVLASASMVVPGVSGSMMLKILGYYNPIVVDTLGGLFRTQLPARDWAGMGHSVLILIPFGIGIVVGIFGVAKLIELLLRRWKAPTYCAILGMVLASPVVILMDKSVYAQGVNAWIITAGVVTLALGVFGAIKLGGGKEEA